MRKRFMIILSAGLLVVITILFIFVSHLSRRQYLANIQSIKADYLEVLRQEGSNLREKTRALESGAFVAFDNPDLPAESLRTKRLFEKSDGKFRPAGMTTVDEQNAEMWKTADEISQATSNRAGPFRIVFKGSILTVNFRDQACLLPVEAFYRSPSNEVVKITTDAPGKEAVVFRQLRFPPVYAWVPTSEFETRKHALEQAYVLTNLMLGVLLAVIIVMGTGIGIIYRHQNEMANLKNAFVSAVSHELRTPMALIRLYAESLTSTGQPAATRDRYTRAIVAETDRLTALVNNVLDFSRLENGTLTLNIIETDVSKKCNEVLDSFSFWLEKEKIALTRKIEPGLKAFVDPIAFTQVVFNLVDNAVKYSGDSRRIEVEITPVDGKICLRVKDNGIGIPDSLKKRVFLPFVRGDDNRVTSQRGTGIGLSITSRLLEQMRCTITFFNNVPEGTVFEVMMGRGPG